MLTVSNAELRSLATGETIVAFVPRGTLTEGDEVELHAGGPAPGRGLKPAYVRWRTATLAERFNAIVLAVTPAAMLDPVAGAARHILSEPGEGDLVVLRVFGSDGPVLSDTAFAARRGSVEGALRT